MPGRRAYDRAIEKRLIDRLLALQQGDASLEFPTLEELLRMLAAVDVVVRDDRGPVFTRWMAEMERQATLRGLHLRAKTRKRDGEGGFSLWGLSEHASGPAPPGSWSLHA